MSTFESSIALIASAKVIRRFLNCQTIIVMELVLCTFNVLFAISFFGESNIDHYVDCVRDVQVQIGRPFSAEEGGTVCIVHFRSEVWSNKAVRKPPSKIEAASAVCILGKRQGFHQICESGGQ